MPAVSLARIRFPTLSIKSETRAVYVHALVQLPKPNVSLLITQERETQRGGERERAFVLFPPLSDSPLPPPRRLVPDKCRINPANDWRDSSMCVRIVVGFCDISLQIYGYTDAS